MKVLFFFGGIILLLAVVLIIIKTARPASESSVVTNSSEPTSSYVGNGDSMIFQHSGLGMQLAFPKGWSLQPGQSSDDQPVRIGFLNAEAAVNITDSELLKGMKIEVVELVGFESASLEAIALQSNDNVPLLEKKNITIGGVDAFRTVHTNFGQGFGTYLRVNGKVIAIMGFVGSLSSLADSEEEYMKIVETFHTL